MWLFSQLSCQNYVFVTGSNKASNNVHSSRCVKGQEISEDFIFFQKPTKISPISAVAPKGQIQPKAGLDFFQKTNLFCLLWKAKKQTKQIRLFGFWENLWCANLILVLSDLYRQGPRQDLTPWPKAIHFALCRLQPTCLCHNNVLPEINKRLKLKIQRFLKY